VGLRTVKELCEIPCYSVETRPPPKKGLCTSRSFGRLVETLPEMEEAVATFVSTAAEKLRRQRCAAGALTVFMMTARFRNEPQYFRSLTAELPVPTNDTRQLIRCAVEITGRAFRRGYRFYKAGVFLSGIVPDDRIQGNLFAHADAVRSRRIMKALDGINGRMGAGAVRYAAEGLKKPWKTRFEELSPRYTTDWNSLAVVTA